LECYVIRKKSVAASMCGTISNIAWNKVFRTRICRAIRAQDIVYIAALHLAVLFWGCL
jgi:hypothetical protein